MGLSCSHSRTKSEVLYIPESHTETILISWKSLQKFEFLTALKYGGAELLIEGELLEVHPAVQTGLHAGGDDHVALRSEGGQDVLLVRAQDAGLSFVGEEDVRQPEALAEVLLPHDVAFALIDIVRQPHVLESQLQEGMHFELQQVGVEILQEVYVNSSLHHDGQAFWGHRVVFCGGFIIKMKFFHMISIKNPTNWPLKSIIAADMS